jgi:hypothetical protein
MVNRSRAESRVILDQLTAAMMRRGWTLRSVEGLPKVYSKEMLVTPYYLNELPRLTSDGWYALGGAVGIIHQAFERIWAQKLSEPKRENEFAMHLLIANLRDLSTLSYIRAEEAEAGISEFAAAICSFLERLPQSEADLVKAFQSPLFCGRPLEHFAGWSNRQKLKDLKNFVEKTERSLTTGKPVDPGKPDSLT